MALHERTEAEWDGLLAAPCGLDVTCDAASGVSDPAAALRQTVLARSTRVLRRRRCARHFTLVAALAACYLGGLASAPFASFRSNGPASSIADSGATAGWPSSAVPCATGSASADDLSATGSASANLAVKPKPANYVRVIADQEPAVAEPKSPRKPPSRFEQLRRISDQYLYQHGDVTTAIRYYRKALDAATAEELAVATDTDSWLLIALKQERLQEKDYEKRST